MLHHFAFSPSGPTRRRPASGLKGLNMAPRALIHTGMGRSASAVSGRSGKPHGSTRTMCFTLWTGHQEKVHASELLFGLERLKERFSFLGGVLSLYSFWELVNFQEKTQIFRNKKYCICCGSSFLRGFQTVLSLMQYHTVSTYCKCRW